MRKWRWVVLYTLLVYGTIPIARPVDNFLRDTFPTQYHLWLNVLLIMIAGGGLTALLVKQSLTRRQWSILGGVGLVVAMVALNMEIPIERIHLVEYMGLGYLIARAMGASFQDPFLVGRALGLVIGIGTGDELIQGAWPERVFDLRDIFFNTISGVAGIILHACTVSNSTPFVHVSEKSPCCLQHPSE